MKVSARLVTLLVVTAFLAVGATVVAYTRLAIVDVQEVEAHLKVSDYVGFNLDTDKLYFGTVMPGGSSERGVELTSREEGPLRVSVKVSGTAAPWIVPENNTFIMEKHATLKFFVFVPENAEQGNYTATVRFFFRRA